MCHGRKISPQIRLPHRGAGRDTESAEMDTLVEGIGKLAGETRKLAREAERQYSPEVEAILKARICDSRRIERCLDGMLDFCFDQCMLVLYRKLCRYYYGIDPEAAGWYVRVYREMWEGACYDLANAGAGGFATAWGVQ